MVWLDPTKEKEVRIGGRRKIMETREVRISVRNFVEFLLRGGDIDHRSYHKPELAM